jgi:arsenate reductase (thioredoxin)
MADRKRVLILCTGNSARSQMAEGLLRHDAGDRFEVESAGTKPSQVRSEAIAVMKEIGIDISGHRSKSVDEFAGRSFDYVLTVCDNAKESCPIFPGHHEPPSSELRGPSGCKRLGREADRGIPPRARRDQGVSEGLCSAGALINELEGRLTAPN